LPLAAMEPPSLPPPSLTDLPTELLVEIISYHAYTFNFLCPLVSQEDSARRGLRREILRSLSQSCSALRSVTLPFLWERFDVSNSIFRPTHPQSEVAKHVFPYIKYVHVSMPSWSISSPLGTETLPLMVEFLCALPSLAGLQIYSPHSSIFSIVSSAFAGVSLPTVSALFLPEELHTIFPAFPNVRTLAFPSFGLDSDAIAAAKAQFLCLDALVGLRIYHGHESFSTLASDFPCLRALSIASPFEREYEPCLRRLSAFTHLTELAFFHEDSFLPLDKLIAGGIDVLRASQSPYVKVLRVWGNDESDGRLVHVERC